MSAKDEIIRSGSLMLAQSGVVDIVDAEMDSIDDALIETHSLTLDDIRFAILFTGVCLLDFDVLIERLGDDPLRQIERALAMLGDVALVNIGDISEDEWLTMMNEAFDVALRRGYQPIDSLEGGNLELALVAKQWGLTPATAFMLIVQLAAILAALDIDDADDDDADFYICIMAAFWWASCNCKAIDAEDVTDDELNEYIERRFSALQDRFCTQFLTGSRRRRVKDLMWA